MWKNKKKSLKRVAKLLVRAHYIHDAQTTNLIWYYMAKCKGICVMYVCLLSVKRKLNNNLREISMAFALPKRNIHNTKLCACVCWSKQFKHIWSNHVCVFSHYLVMGPKQRKSLLILEKFPIDLLYCNQYYWSIQKLL